MTINRSVPRIRIIQVDGLSKVKWELFVTSEFGRQAGIPLAHMEFIYRESSFTEDWSRHKLFEVMYNTPSYGNLK